MLLEAVMTDRTTTKKASAQERYLMYLSCRKSLPFKYFCDSGLPFPTNTYPEIRHHENPMRNPLNASSNTQVHQAGYQVVWNRSLKNPHHIGSSSFQRWSTEQASFFREGKSTSQFITTYLTTETLPHRPALKTVIMTRRTDSLKMLIKAQYTNNSHLQVFPATLCASNAETVSQQRHQIPWMVCSTLWIPDCKMQFLCKEKKKSEKTH